MRKFRCTCGAVSSVADIDMKGNDRWTSSYNSIISNHPDKPELPYICPVCGDDPRFKNWKEIAVFLPEELFTL
jgi:hypothetical protein